MPDSMRLVRTLWYVPPLALAWRAWARIKARYYYPSYFYNVRVLVPEIVFVEGHRFRPSESDEDDEHEPERIDVFQGIQGQSPEIASSIVSASVCHVRMGEFVDGETDDDGRKHLNRGEQIEIVEHGYKRQTK